MKFKIIRTFFFLSAFFVEVSVSYAAERFEFFNGARQMAMGGASIGVVNDETALLSNPNGLGKLRDHIFTVIDPEGTATDNYGEHLLDGKNPFDYFELEGVLKALNQKQNEDLYSKIQMMPSFVFPNFGIGLFKKINYAAVSDATGANVDVRFFDDTALLLGYNFRLFGGRVKLGFTGKYINRASASETLATNLVKPDIDTYVSEGVGIGADVGLTLSAPWTWLPAISLVVRDVGNTNFKAASGMFYNANEIPNTLDQTIDAAFSFFPIHSNHVRSSFTFEVKDIEDILEENDLTRRSHAGWELNMHDIFFLRAGMNQRYWTAGIELSLANVQMQASTYGEDIGTVDVPEESRRFVFKLSYRF